MDNLTNTFWSQGLSYANRSTSLSSLTGIRVFKSFYGIAPEVCSKLWRLLADKPSNSEPKYLLWALFFLKRYNTEHVNAALVKCDEKTFRKWIWIFIKLLSSLELVLQLMFYSKF